MIHTARVLSAALRDRRFRNPVATSCARSRTRSHRASHSAIHLIVGTARCTHESGDDPSAAASL